MKTVVFSQSAYLPCVCDPENTIVLCLTDPSLVAQAGSSTIEGHVEKTFRINTPSCGRICTTFNYVVTYDEAQLADPNIALTTAQVISAFCNSCLTTWVEEQIEINGGGGGEGLCSNIVAVSTEEELIAALDDGAAQIYICDSITFSQDVTIEAVVVIPEGNVLFANGNAVVFNNVIQAGLYKIIDPVSGPVTFGPDSNTEVYPQWWGAQGDDFSDDTQAIQYALNQGGNRAVVFPKVSDKYAITGNLNPVSNSVIRGQSYPVIHQTTVRLQSFEIGSDITNVLIEGLHFETDGTFNIAQAGRSVIDLNSAGIAAYAENITIRDCTILRTPISGISTYKVRNIRIENCVIDFSVGEHGIYLLDAEKVFITNNSLLGPGVSSNGSSAIKVAGLSTDFIVSHNSLDTVLTYGINIATQSGVPTGGTVSNNIIEAAYQGMYINGIRISLTSNTITSPTRDGIAISDGVSITCCNNVITNVATVGYHGISITASDSVANDNVITDCPNGIQIGITCVNVTLANNKIVNTTNAGSRAFNLAGPLGAYIPVWIYNNVALGYAALMYYADEYCYEWANFISADQTVPLKKASCCLKPAAITNGTTNGFMRTTAETAFQTSDGAVFIKASTDNVWNLTALTTAVGMYAKVALCGTSANTFVVVKGAEASSRNASRLPWVRNSYAIIGYVQLEPSYAGGSLSGAFMSDCVGLQNLP